MYAIIATGGKQLKVKLGGRYQVEKLKSTKINENFSFNFVLLLNDGNKISVGQPFVPKTQVESIVVDEAKGPKIRIIKMRRRKHSMTKTGHRQKYTWVKITAIKQDDKIIAELTEKTVAKKPVAEKPAVEKPVVKKLAAEKPKATTTKKASAE